MGTSYRVSQRNATYWEMGSQGPEEWEEMGSFKVDDVLERCKKCKVSKRANMSVLLYADNLVLSGESEEYLRTIEGHFVEVCRKGLKVKVMVLDGEERLECEVCVDGIR